MMTFGDMMSSDFELYPHGVAPFRGTGVVPAFFLRTSHGLLLFESSSWSFPFPHASVSLHFIMVEQVTTGRVLWRCK